MVSNKFSEDDVRKKAKELDFPGSVLEFFEGLMGQPYGGFPEPLRSDALRGRRKLDKRPGLTLEPMDLKKIKADINKKFGSASECDVASYAMYPKVFEDYRKFISKYGDLSVLPTRYFLARPDIGEEFHVELERGKVLILKLLAIGPLSEQTGQREVFYEMNGEVRQVSVEDKHAAVENVARPKADSNDSSQVGAPMSGVVVEVRVHDGGEVKKGDPVAVLSAMKMVSSYISSISPPPPHKRDFCVQRKFFNERADSERRKWSSAPPILEKWATCRSRKATALTDRTWSARSSKTEQAGSEQLFPTGRISYFAYRYSITFMEPLREVYNPLFHDRYCATWLLPAQGICVCTYLKTAMVA